MRSDKGKWLPKIAERLIQPKLEQVPQSDEEFARKIGISYMTYLSNKKQILDEWAKASEGGETAKFVSRLKELAMLGRNPKYMQMVLDYLGIYREKQEVKIDLILSAEDLIRRNLRAEAELDAEGYRVEEMPIESTVLPEELRLGAGQGKTEDSSMAGMESPDDNSEAGTGVAQSVIPPNPTLSDSVQVSADRA